MWFFLDRDGVINYDSKDFVRHAAEWKPITGSLEAIAALKQAGHHVVVCTNQSGIARGHFDLDALEQMHLKMQQLLQAQGCQVDAIFYCPHHPDDHCACRKPHPGMLYAAAYQFGLSPDDVIMIGDSKRDIEAGRAFGCQVALVLSGKGQHCLEQAEKAKDTAFLTGLKIYNNLADLVHSKI